MKTYLALGDCNTLGIRENEGNAYPERISAALQLKAMNKGYTMSSSYEMVELFRDNMAEDIVLVSIQCALVDSWRTFRYAPYVKYYPDNILRKIARKVIKKYKKVARRLGLQHYFGDKYVVDESVYLQNLREIIETTEIPVLLIETTPTSDPERNRHIRHYNQLLERLADRYSHTFIVRCFDDFLRNMDQYIMDDGVHITDAGYDLITAKVVNLVEDRQLVE
jgi:hypothetical protein